MLGIFFTLAAAITLLVITSVVGVPLAVRLARPKVWGRSRIGAMPATGAPLSTNPSFTPLDLGPDPMRWPSQTPWESKARPELPWPSQTWDDPHFGRHWDGMPTGSDLDAAYEARKAERRARAEQARAARVENRPAQPQATNPTAQRARQEMRQLRERAARMKAQMQDQVGDRGQQLAQQARERASQAVRDKAQEVAPQLASAVSNVPPPAELERLVSEVGLAGTVQEIMKRTGWDFKTAAQYLAKARRGR